MKKFIITISFILALLNMPAQLTIINQVNPICSGMCNGSVTFSISGGTMPYTLMNLGTTSCTVAAIPPFSTNTITVSGLCPCSYNFMVLDATASIIGSQMVSILAPATLNAILTKTNVCCNSACNGAISAFVMGGTAPYTYAWSPFVTGGATVTNLCSGNYTLSVTDSNGCIGLFTTQIIQPPVFALTSSITPASCSTCCTGQINVTGTGGQPGYTYTVFPGNLTNATGTFSNMCSGAYSVCASDAGCCFTCIGVTVNTATTTAIADLQNENTIVFYPNPSSGTIKTNYKGSVSYSIEVLDVLGGLVYKDKLTEQINLSKQQEGIYFILIKDSESRVLSRQRIIINR